MKCPEEYAASGSESAEQTALFMWAAMAARFGYRAAADPLCYSVQGHAMVNYGPKNARGCGTQFADTYGPEAVPELEDMFAIPNGGKRDKITAANLRREGVKRGVPDVFLPVRRGAWAGLFIELKRGKSATRTASGRKRAAGTTTDDQDDWIARLQRRGFGAVAVVGWIAARDMIISYLSSN